MASKFKLTQTQRTARARVGMLSARAARLPNDPVTVQAIEDARRVYKEVSAEAYIRRLVDDAPPLTAEQRDRLASLLRGSETR